MSDAPAVSDAPAAGPTLRFVVTLDGRAEPVEVTGRDGRYRLALGDRTVEVDARQTMPGLYSLLIDGVSCVVDVSAGDGAALVDVGGSTYRVEVEEHMRHVIRTRGGTAGGTGGQTIRAPLPGKITHVAVAPGDPVAAGATVVVIEAMKMENEFKAAVAGTVTEVRVAPGQAVNPGDVLVVIAG